MSTHAFEKGDVVKVNSPEHRMDGETGTIIEYGKFMGTWSVDISGRTYGLFASELIKEEKI